MALSLANVKTILDGIAQQAKNIQESGFDANTTGYENNRTTILGGDIAAAADLASAFRTDPALVSTFQLEFEGRRTALARHLDGISAYLVAQDARVSKYLRNYLGWTMSAAAVFQDPVLSGASKMGSFTLSGAGAGTFTDGSAVDTTLYGKVWLRVVVKAQTASAEIVATIIGTKIDGTSQSKQVTITNGAIVDTAFNVGVLGTTGDHFVDVTNVTVTGGGASDSFHIESRLERTIAL